MNFRQPKTIKDFLEIKRLYRKAFPKCERKPFSLIMKWYKAGKSDIWYFYDEQGFLGFSSTINGEREILIDYFAVSEKRRGSGNGTEMIKSLIEHYLPNGVFLEIEKLDERASNNAQRIRRRKFYISAGLEPLGTYAKLFGTDMELLGVGCSMDYEKYRSFYLENYSRFAYNNITTVE